MCRSAAAEATLAEIAGNTLLLLFLPAANVDESTVGPTVLLLLLLFAIIEDAI